MRSSQSALGSSGMWNWTCSVVSAITAVSSLASGSLNVAPGKWSFTLYCNLYLDYMVTSNKLLYHLNLSSVSLDNIFSGIFMVSSCCKCRFYLHDLCLMLLSRQYWQHPAGKRIACTFAYTNFISNLNYLIIYITLWEEHEINLNKLTKKQNCYEVEKDMDMICWSLMFFILMFVLC